MPNWDGSIIKFMALLVPPGVVTVTLAGPGEVLDGIENIALISLLLMTFTSLTMTPALLSLMTAPAMKLLPASVTGTLTPAAPLLGSIESSEGGAATEPLWVTGRYTYSLGGFVQTPRDPDLAAPVLPDAVKEKSIGATRLPDVKSIQGNLR